MFLAYIKQLRNSHLLEDIFNKKEKWPSDPKDRDVLYFLAQSFRARLMEELPKTKQDIRQDKLAFVYRAKDMIRQLAHINFEIAQMTVADDSGRSLPDWFVVEVARDLPRIAS